MVFNIREIVSHVSKNMTLLPGDIILTGSPAGIAPIKTGDIIECEIEGIGVVENPIVDWTEDVTQLSNLNKYKAVIFASNSRDEIGVRHDSPATASPTHTASQASATPACSWSGCSRAPSSS